MKSAISEKSSGNVFKDLGFADANQLFMKAQLAFRLAAIIGKRESKHADTAEILEISQRQLSLIKSGKVDKFSAARLMEFFTKLGYDVEIIIRRKQRSSSVGEIRII